MQHRSKTILQKNQNTNRQKTAKNGYLYAPFSQEHF